MVCPGFFETDVIWGNMVCGMEINGENFAKCSHETDGPDGPRGVKYDKSFFQTGERKKT